MNMNCRKLISAVVLCTALVVSGSVVAKTTLKMASLAPTKSTWTKMFKHMASELDERTGGTIGVDLFVGGVQGDEKEVVEKLRTGQLQMAAITAVGLGKIVPDTLVFQLPGLYPSAKMLDKARNGVTDGIEKQMDKAGFVLLGWGDVGPNYYFTNKPVTGPESLKASKMWVWSDDPIAQAIVRNAGASGVPMGVPSVTAALANGKINGYFTSPLAAASLRWYNRTDHIAPVPISMSIGAVVITKAAFEALSAEEQGHIRDIAAKWATILTKQVRKDNRKTLRLMADAAYAGVKVSKSGELSVGAAKEGATKPVVSQWSADDRKAWQAVFEKVQDELAGKVYSKDLLKRVRALVR